MNMVSRATPSSSRAPKGSPTQSLDRTWFLRSAVWGDSIWTFAPTNVLEESHPVRIRWDFTLPSGGRFTDEQHALLLDSSKQLVALIRARSLSTGLAQRANTAAGYFMYLRVLVCWMNEVGFTRFTDLDEQAVLQFQRHISDRPGVARTGLPQPFLHDIKQGVVTETWAEGPSMFHNPKALHPVDHEMFPGIAHHWLDDGHIRSLVPEFHPYSSLTWNMLAIDGMPGQQSQPKSPAAP